MPAQLITRAFQWDLARQVERLEVLLALLPKYSEWGYTELYLHLEDAVEYPHFPQIARPDAYRHSEIAQLVSAAGQVGIGVVPIVNLLGHTQYLIKTAELRDLNEMRDAQGQPLEQGQICPLHPRTLAVAASLLDDVRPFCTAGKVHVGLDESFHLGRCPRCQTEIAQRGLPYHFSNYVKRLHHLTEARHLQLALWADMLNFIPKAIPLLPRGIAAYDWYYYPFEKCPKVELYNFADCDLAPALEKQGIEYWGCPMNGAFRYEPLPLFKDRLANLRSWWRRCQMIKAKGFLITSWEAYRLALPMTTVVDAAAAALWKTPSKHTDLELLTFGFTRAFGEEGAHRSAEAALRADQYPFAGYAKWETNQRWDGLARYQTGAEIKEEAKYLRKLTQSAPPNPALAASLSFRYYLAARDFFIERAARGVFAARRALSKNNKKIALRILRSLKEDGAAFASNLTTGKLAARTMWQFSRSAQAKSQNLDILKQDQARLALWRNWLKQTQRNLDLFSGATLVCGRWQLVCEVVNFAPACQRLAVEAKVENTWTEIYGRHTIEFQAIAARARAKVVRIFSVPIPLQGTPLRFVLSGVGELKLRAIYLTDGVEVFPATYATMTLGKSAPKRGLPNIFKVQARRRVSFKKRSPQKRRSK